MKPKPRPQTAVVQAPPEDEPSDLMKRLAQGTKVAVDKKEMKALTTKNYNNLPEVKKLRAEQEKKEAFKERMKQVKELEAKRR